MKAKNWLLAMAVAGMVAVGGGPAWAVSGTSAAVTVRTQGLPVVGHAVVGYVPYKVGSGDEAGIWLDGAVLFSSVGEKTFDWEPQTTGNHKIEFRLNGVAVTSKTVNVASLAFAVEKGANPPTAADPNLSITPVTRSFGTGGGGAAIAVSGSGTWEASASDPWITLKATSGQAGLPLAYTVAATTNVESRTGYVYVSGHVHTVTQEGAGGSISPANATFETLGGTGTIEVTAPSQKTWQARPNVQWLSVLPARGTGAGAVSYSVAPWNEVNTRQGSLTVAGQTFTVFQYGRRIKISPQKAEYDYLTHVIPITVDALATTTWSVTPQNSWISIVDGGNGKGSDVVTVAIAENPSWKARTGTVKIGTETFSVTQKGRTALVFDINPKSTTANVNGANGIIAVTATPDLPWSAASGANWLTLYAATASGAGNGNAVYSASPNPTLYDRTGSITVTPGDKSVSAKTHTVKQAAASSALSANGYEFAAEGENCEVRVSVADIVQWQIQNGNGWLKVLGETNRMGPATVTLQAVPNETVQPRSGTVTIARKTFKVSQKARGVEVEYETKLFGTDGGDGTILVHPDGDVSWTAVASDPSMIVIFTGESGTGEGEIYYIVSPYVGEGQARTGTITVGDKVVYITQRPYDLGINPNGTQVKGNNGAGEFGVSAGIGAVWTAIATEPWITFVEGYDAGTGNGTVRFIYTDNDTGKTRTGKIIVAGEVYTLEQQARQLVVVTAKAGHGGTVTGAGTYDRGTDVTLRAVPDSGYEFVRWTGDVTTSQNPLTVTVDVPTAVAAVFEPLPVAFGSVVSDTNGVALAWNNLAWALTYRLFRGTSEDISAASVLAEISNTGNCTYMDRTGELDVTYRYWVEAVGVQEDVTSAPATGKKEKPPVFSPIAYTGLKGASNPNPTTYREGTVVTFANPGAVEGYTFSGWQPAQITAVMTGSQTVKATWTPNAYRIEYEPNGGSGTTEPTSCAYDQAATVASNGFVWAGHCFTGWGTEATGEVVYAEGQSVTNLTAEAWGVVTLWAAWRLCTLAEAVGVPELAFATGGGAEWRMNVDSTAKGGTSAQSGSIGAESETWMEAILPCAGTFRFDWKVDCEKDDFGDVSWDHLSVSVDGTEKMRLDGTTEWETVTLDVAGEGPHSVRWSFSKDDYDEPAASFSDLAWVAGAIWVPSTPGDVFPAVESDAAAAVALAGAADGRLARCLASLEAYDDFRAWMAVTGISQQAAKDSPHAWISYALGAESLFSEEPVVKLGGLSLGRNGTKEAEGATMVVEVSVTVGGAAVEVAPAKVAALFECTTDLRDWTGGAALVPAVARMEDGAETMRFEITPGDGTARRVFLRMAE